MNVTMINAGQQHNVVPGEVTISVDMRISPHDKLEVSPFKLCPGVSQVLSLCVSFAGHGKNGGGLDDGCGWGVSADYEHPGATLWQD